MKNYKNGIELLVQVNGFTIQKYKLMKTKLNSDFSIFSLFPPFFN